MRKSQWLLIPLLAGLTTPIGRAQPPAPLASFYGIGDLPGGPTTSIVRDATKVGGTIYAVGGSNATNPNSDSAVIWTFDGANPATLTQLPSDLLNGGGSIAAAAITASASFIASQARYSVSGPRSDNGQPFTLPRVQPVRVEGSVPFQTMNLNTAPFPTYVSAVPLGGGLTGVSVTVPQASSAAISDDGSVLYGSAQQTTGGVNFNRAVRFDVLNQTSMLIPLLNPGDTTNGPAARGTSRDGLVMVGTSFGGPAGANAFRYEHGNPGTVTAIPPLPGGTVNAAAAVSPDGDLTLVFGNSTFSVLPRNEMYLHNAPTGAVTRLGSPNTAWRTTGGGMTFDGSVVAATFAAPQTTCAPTPCTPPTPARYAYFRNSRGWFRLESALAAQGVFLPNMGWTELQITGMSSDGTLVFGQGRHNIAAAGFPAVFVPEGFVAQFAPDYLKNFDVPTVAPTDTSIVGAWVFPEPADPGSDPAVVVFLADGTYFNIESGLAEADSADGFERGRYFWNPQTQAFAADTLVDTNGETGLSGLNGIAGTTLAISGADITVTFPAGLCDGTPADPCVFTGTRVAISPGSLAGAWYAGNPTLADSSIVLVLLDDGSYYFAEDGDSSPAGDPNGIDGIEKGTWTWNAATGNFSTVTTVDTNREWGLNAQFPLPGSQSVLTVQLTPDGLGLVGPGFSNLTRVIDPATIPAIANTPLSASGVVGMAFGFDVTATNTVTFSAAGLPDGLSINSGTGDITGTPGIGGQFAVMISATNAAGVSDIETLTLTIAIPTPIGQNVVVEPEVPEGLGPVTMTFDEVTTAGQTTVTVLRPEEVPPVPGGFDLAGIIYDVETTAEFDGLIVLCFSYAGVDFGAATPRLLHYEDNQWVDITTSVDTATETICGATSSLSPFAIIVSPILRTGFYSPVSPVVGFLNTVKGGATVPLKFNVSVNGVQQTVPNGLEFTVQPIGCDSDAIEDPVDFVTSGATTLRYDAAAGLFIQNWKVPKTPGACYLVRITTEADGLALTARFKVK